MVMFHLLLSGDSFSALQVALPLKIDGPHHSTFVFQLTFLSAVADIAMNRLLEYELVRHLLRLIRLGMNAQAAIIIEEQKRTKNLMMMILSRFPCSPVFSPPALLM